MLRFFLGFRESGSSLGMSALSQRVQSAYLESQFSFGISIVSTSAIELAGLPHRQITKNFQNFETKFLENLQYRPSGRSKPSRTWKLKSVSPRCVRRPCVGVGLLKAWVGSEALATCKTSNFCSVSLTRYRKHSKWRRTMQGPTSPLPVRAFEVLKRVASNESQNHRFKSQVRMLSFAFLKRDASALPQRLRPRAPDGLGLTINVVGSDQICFNVQKRANWVQVRFVLTSKNARTRRNPQHWSDKTSESEAQIHMLQISKAWLPNKFGVSNKKNRAPIPFI